MSVEICKEYYSVATFNLVLSSRRGRKRKNTRVVLVCVQRFLTLCNLDAQSWNSLGTRNTAVPVPSCETRSKTSSTAKTCEPKDRVINWDELSIQKVWNVSHCKSRLVEVVELPGKSYPLASRLQRSGQSALVPNGNQRAVFCEGQRTRYRQHFDFIVTKPTCDTNLVQG